MARRPYGSLVLETYIYYHNQNPDAGLVVRKRTRHSDVSRYFSAWRYGSLSKAEWHARRWKNQTIIARRRFAA
jgi:hypothetical protein